MKEQELRFPPEDPKREEAVIDAFLRDDIEFLEQLGGKIVPGKVGLSEERLQQLRSEIVELKHKAEPMNALEGVELSNLTDKDIVFYFQIKEGIFGNDDVERMLNRLFMNHNAANESRDAYEAAKFEQRIHFYHWVRTQVKKKKV